MATEIKSIVPFVNVAPGATVSLPHGLVWSPPGGGELPQIPDHVTPDASGFIITADDTDVTVTNTNPVAVSVNVLCELWHSLERAFGPPGVLELVPRPFVEGDAGGGGGGSPVNVQDEGVLVGTRLTLNFIGVSVAAVDDPPNNRVNVTVSPDPLEVEDEGVPVGSRPTMNFTGGGVTAVDNPGMNRIDVSIPGGGGAGEPCVVGFGDGNLGAAADTRFLDPWFGSRSEVAGTDILEKVMPRAGMLQSLFVRHNRATGNGNAVDYVVMVNGVASLLAASLATGAIGVASDLVNIVAVAQGDRVALRAVKAATIGNGQIEAVATMELV